MADDLASVSVTIVFEDFDDELRDRLDRAVKGAASEAEKNLSKSGKQAGKKFADSFDKEASRIARLDKMQDALKRLEATAVKAGNAQADAAGKVRVAEQQLADLRAKGNAKLGQIVAAEERLATARRNAAESDNTAKAAAEALQKARIDVEKAASESGDAAGDRFVKSFRETVEKDSKRDGDKAGGFFGEAFRSAIQRVVGKGGLLLSVAVPAAPAAIAAVTTLAGAIGQLSGAAALLPGVLGSAAAALATVKIGTQGVSDAFKALAGDDAEALKEALAKLAPNAAAFVTAVGALRPAFDALRLDVQQNLFQGLGESLTQLATVALPILRTGLSEIATSLSSLGGTLLTAFQTPASLAALQSILANTREALINLQPAIAPVVAAFSTLASVGSSFLPGLSKSLADVAERFNTFVQTAAVSGALQDFIQGGIDAVKSLGATIGNVVEIFSGLARAGGDAGAGLFSGLESITQALADFVNSAGGQDILGTILANVAAGAKLIGETITPLLPAILEFAAAFQSVTAAITPLLPVLGTALAGVIRSLAPVLSSLAGPLAQVAAAVAPLITTLGAGLQQVIAALAPVVSALATGLAPVLSTIVGVITQLIPFLAQFIAQFAAGLLPVITTLMPVIQQLAVAFGQVLVSFVQLLPSLLPLLPPLAQLSVALAQVVVALSPLIVLAAQLAVEFFGKLTPAIQAAVPIVLLLVNALTRFVTSLAQVLTAIVAFTVAATQAFVRWVNQTIANVQALPGRVSGFLTSMATTSLNILSGFVTSAAALAGKVASGIVNAIKSGLSGLAGVFRAPFDNAKTAVSNALSGILSTVEGFISRISGAISKISSAISSIPRPNFPGIDIPGFANGTIATRPTLGVFGEAGAEAVIPLTRPKRALELMDKSGLLDLALSAGKAGGKPGKSKEIHMPIYAQGVSAEAVVDLIETKLGVRFGPSIGIDTSAGVI